MAGALESAWPELERANALDVAEAEQAAATGALKPSLVERLRLSEDKLRQMVKSVREVEALADPVGQVRLHRLLDDGLELKKVTFPFGVVAAIVEARPDAVVQLAALALKSGNALMIKAGVEATRTAQCAVDVMARAMAEAGIPAAALTLVKGRDAVRQMLRLDEWIDLVVPRGGAELVRYVMENSTIPVLGHAEGVCHIFVDRNADQEMALDVVLDSKVQAPSVCNAVETVLVDEAIAGEFLPRLVCRLKAAGVRLLGCRRVGRTRQRRDRGDRAGGMAHRVWRADAGHKGRRRPGRGDRTHRDFWLAPHRLHRHRRRADRPSASCNRSTRRMFSITSPPVSRTDSVMASARRSGSAPESCTRGGRWASMAWSLINTSSADAGNWFAITSARTPSRSNTSACPMPDRPARSPQPTQIQRLSGTPTLRLRMTPREKSDTPDVKPP